MLAIRNFLKEPDVIAVQEVAVFADGANALTGLAAALGNYTPYIATNNDGRGIAPGFLVKNGTTADRRRGVGEERPSPWGSSAVCDLHPGPLFDRAPYQLEIKKGDIALTALSNHFASQSHQNAVPHLGGRVRPPARRRRCRRRARTSSSRVTSTTSSSPRRWPR